MEDFLATLASVRFLSNPLLDWLFAAGLGTFVYFALALLFRLLKSNLGRLSRKTETVADDLVLGALESTKQFALVFAGIWAGTQVLVLGRAETAIDFAFLAVATLQVAIWANKAVTVYIGHYTETRREQDPGSVSALQGMSFIVRLMIWSIALLLVLDNLGFEITTLVAGLGIGGIAIALAVQSILGDLFASLSIVMDKPFVIGDFIVVDDLQGVVERIGIKTTRVRSLSGEQLVFANSDLLNSRIRNFKRMYERRVPFKFGVTYQTAPEQLEAIPPKVKEIVEGLEGTRFDRAHFQGFGESSLDFEVVYYLATPDYGIYMDKQQEINLAIYRYFREQGIEFAYPTRTLFLNRERGDEPTA